MKLKHGAAHLDIMGKAVRSPRKHQRGCRSPPGLCTAVMGQSALTQVGDRDHQCLQGEDDSSRFSTESFGFLVFLVFFFCLLFLFYSFLCLITFLQWDCKCLQTGNRALAEAQAQRPGMNENTSGSPGSRSQGPACGEEIKFLAI